MARINKGRKAYDSGDVIATINGVPVDVVEVSYDMEQEHQLNHTLGNDAHSWSMGKKTPTATVTLMMEDAVRIEDSANGDLLSIKPFDLNITFANDYGKLVNDTIVAKFKNQGREVTGDMGLQKQYTLFALDIQFNNV